MDIALEPERHESEQIPVFGSGTDTRLQDVPTRVGTQDQELIALDCPAD